MRKANLAEGYVWTFHADMTAVPGWIVVAILAAIVALMLVIFLVIFFIIRRARNSGHKYR